MGRFPYLSHGSTSSPWVPRHDPVVYPGVAGPLSAADLESFDTDGFLVLPGTVSAAEAALALEETYVLVKRGTVPVTHEREGMALRSVFRLHTEPSPALSFLVTHPVLTGAVCQILGSEVYVHDSRVDFRTLEVGEFNWRSDYQAWHDEHLMAAMRAVTVCVMLTPSSPGNGPLLVAPGSHRSFVPRLDPRHPHPHRFGRHDDPVISRAALTWMVDDGGITAILGGPGTVVLLDCNLLHATPGSLSPHRDAALFVAFNSVANAPEPRT